MTDKDWLRRFEEANELLISIRNALNGNQVSQQSMEIRKQFMKFDQNLTDLHTTVSRVGGTSGEQARRKGKLNKMQQERARLQETFKARTGSSTVPKWRPPGSGSGSGGAAETLQTLGLENDQILQLQTDTMRQQDEDLEGLHTTTLRIKNIGRMIGSELEEQNHLLDVLSEEEDIAIDRLARERKRITTLVNDNKDGISFCCVLVLVVGLVILVLALAGVI
uniref:t-SNARE coiled-coil homology domain-containing protein n=1 Tax=Eutreptiella gymnastica TaxID=73025 RepID=A0A7S1N2H4_9EUGL